LGLEKLYAQRQRVQDTLEEKVGAIGYDSGNVKVHWKNIKEFMLDNISDLIGKFENRARKPRIHRKLSVKWMIEGN